MARHAFLSPSDAPHWMLCPAKPWMEKDIPGGTSSYASEGTSAHALREACLTSGKDAKDFIGEKFGEYVVDSDMAEHVQKSVDLIRVLPGELYCEVRLPITGITGEPEAFGTADAVILDHATGRLTVNDLKYGRGVAVDVVENEQLLIYAAAAVKEFEFLMPVTEVCMQISQPRNGGESEWVLPIEELRQRTEKISGTADDILNRKQATPQPGEKQCRFCRAKATCPALREEVLSTVVGAPVTIDDFTDGGHIVPTDNEMLGKCLVKIGLIEAWCSAIRAKAEEELNHGNAVPGFKLVEGRAGNRSWSDTSEVEALFKSMRLPRDVAYEHSLISPTTAEKLAKSGAIKPRQWKNVEKLITRSAGKPTVAPESDKRPATRSIKDDFEDLV